MVPWWTLLIPGVLFLIFWVAYSRAAYERDRAIRAVQMVEMEYRLMCQNNAMFRSVEEIHDKLEGWIEEACAKEKN